MAIIESRRALQRVATHVLARRRHAVTGRFGLRATPGGFGTPAFGDDVEVLRVAGTALVREAGGNVATHPIHGATLAELAAFVGVDLTRPFDAGHDTPPAGDTDAPIDLDPAACAVIADWYSLGWRAIDGVVSRLGAEARASATQLWPEHFDAGGAVAVGAGRDDRCNLGASPGDSYSDEPYLYVGPWSEARPGDAGYWNAPFGAVLRRSDLAGRDDGADVAGAVAFFLRGVELQRSVLDST